MASSTAFAGECGACGAIWSSGLSASAGPFNTVTAAAFTFVAVTPSAQPPQPAPDWVLVTVNGEQGWVPPLHPLATVIQSDPEPPANCVEPYGIGQCGDNEPVRVFEAGRCSSVTASRTQPGATLVSGEWLPNSDSNTSGVVAFYADAPLLSFRPMPCPADPVDDRR